MKSSPKISFKDVVNMILVINQFSYTVVPHLLASKLNQPILNENAVAACCGLVGCCLVFASAVDGSLARALCVQEKD